MSDHEHPLARAARKQGIKPVTRLGELAAAPEGRPSDDEAEAYFAAIRSGRGDDSNVQGELVHAGLDAIWRKYRSIEADVRDVLAAVLPLHERQVLERLGKPCWRYRAFGPNNEIVFDPDCNDRWTMAELGGWRIERQPVYSGAWEPAPGPTEGGTDD